ncbi:polyketide cyclase [Thermoleophilia bacterium SCSIO 60948]|nr:polyketide cyclase [Thermoleophilia bacterium SCSIO 60948]
MPSVSRTFDVSVPPNVVVPYLADFANAEEWDPGTERCVPNQEGPPEIGSSWKNTSKIAGITTELTYTLEDKRDDLVVLVGRNKTATSTETIEVKPNGGGSRVAYTNAIEFNGASKLASPLAKVVFEKVASDTEKQLSESLEKRGR